MHRRGFVGLEAGCELMDGYGDEGILRMGR